MIVRNEIVIVNKKYHIKEIVGMTGVVINVGISYSEVEPLRKDKFKGIFSIPNECLE